MQGIPSFLMGWIIARAGRDDWSSGGTCAYGFAIDFVGFGIIALSKSADISWVRKLLFTVGSGAFGGTVAVVLGRLQARLMQKKQAKAGAAKQIEKQCSSSNHDD